jgi:hypothetical protein
VRIRLIFRQTSKFSNLGLLLIAFVFSSRGSAKDFSQSLVEAGGSRGTCWSLLSATYKGANPFSRQREYDLAEARVPRDGESSILKLKSDSDKLLGTYVHVEIFEHFEGPGTWSNGMSRSFFSKVGEITGRLLGVFDGPQPGEFVPRLDRDRPRLKIAAGEFAAIEFWSSASRQFFNSNARYDRSAAGNQVIVYPLTKSWSATGYGTRLRITPVGGR